MAIGAYQFHILQAIVVRIPVFVVNIHRNRKPAPLCILASFTLVPTYFYQEPFIMLPFDGGERFNALPLLLLSALLVAFQRTVLKIVSNRAAVLARFFAPRPTFALPLPVGKGYRARVATKSVFSLLIRQLLAAIFTQFRRFTVFKQSLFHHFGIFLPQRYYCCGPCFIAPH
jgi:hypothetical protein